MRLSRLARAPRATAITAAVVLLATLTPAPTFAAPATPWVTVATAIGGCRLSGSVNLGTSDVLRVKHRRADGTLVTTTTIQPEAASWSRSCPGPTIRVGDRIQFYRGAETTPFHVLRVPRLVLRPDRDADVMAGTASGSPDLLSLSATACSPGGTDCTKVVDITPVPDPATGAFSVPVGDLRGGDTLFAVWQRDTDTIYLQGYVGQLVVTPGNATIGGRGPNPGMRVAITLRRGDWTGSTTTKVDANGQYAATIRRHGRKVVPKLGDVITSDVTSGARVKVPPTNLYWDDTRIAGRCFKNGWVSIAVLDADGRPIHQVSDAAFEDGSFLDEHVVGASEHVVADCANLRGDTLHLVGIKS